MNPGRSCRCHPHQCTTARRRCGYVVYTTTELVGGWGVYMNMWVDFVVMQISISDEAGLRACPRICGVLEYFAQDIGVTTHTPYRAVAPK